MNMEWGCIEMDGCVYIHLHGCGLGYCTKGMRRLGKGVLGQVVVLS